MKRPFQLIQAVISRKNSKWLWACPCCAEVKWFFGWIHIGSKTRCTEGVCVLRANNKGWDPATWTQKIWYKR